NLFQGQATVYAGAAKAANKTYKYFGPSLDATQRLLAEISRDQRNFTNFLVSSGRVLTAIGERRNDLTNLVSNANTTLAAIAGQNQALDTDLVNLPPTLRQANTTFVNLRAALDDLTPLVNATKPATKTLPRFLRTLRRVADRAVRALPALAPVLRKPGPNNAVAAAFRGLRGLRRTAAGAAPRAPRALRAPQPTVAFARPYTPDLAAFLTKLGQV